MTSRARARSFSPGVLAAVRAIGRPLAEQRFVFLGAALPAPASLAPFGGDGRPGRGRRHDRQSHRHGDTNGLVFSGRDNLDDDKREFALRAEALAHYGLGALNASDRLSLEAIVAAVKPTVLIGTSGVAGAFTEAAIREMAAHVERPVVFPLSNPTAKTEAIPSDIWAWTGGPRPHRHRQPVRRRRRRWQESRLRPG